MFKSLWAWIQRLASPKIFYSIAGQLIPWLLTGFGILTIVGLYWGLFIAPIDYQQGDSYRIMFLHVPAAWMSMLIYFVMAVWSIIGLVWRIKLADMVAKSSALIGVAFTLIALLTGSIWGKPMWGTWWVWDARLTSELVLFFLYLAYMALGNAFSNPQSGARASAVLAIVGLINLPIIHYSVNWWNTLHQGASVSKIGAPSIHIDMLIPLLLMTAAFKLMYGGLVLIRTRNEVLLREQDSRWVKELIIKEYNKC